MITSAILSLISSIFGFILSIFPVVTLADIPVIGSYVSSTLVTMVKTWNAGMVTFPYMQIVWTVFISVIIPFEIAMLALKFFLGHRAPNATTTH